MRILEMVFLAAVFVSVALFLALMTGGATLIMITLTLLSFLYFGVGFVFFSKVKLRTVFKGGLKNTPGSVVAIGAITGVALSTLAIGILFKLLLMPGADEMLLVGGVESTIMLAVNAFYLIKNKSDTAKLCLSRLLIFLLPSIFLLASSPLTLVQWQYRNHPGYVDAFAKFLAEPNSKENWELLNLERNRVHLSPEEFEVYKKARLRN